MAVAVQQSSAANLLALLDEEDDALKLYALQSLNKVVHEFWYQIATVIASVEAFYEDEEFSHRELAALVASKVCYWRPGQLISATPVQVSNPKHGSQIMLKDPHKVSC